MCGSPSVVLVDEGAPFSNLGPAQPPHPPASVDEFKAAFGPLFEEALDYVRARDKQREDRDVLLDAAETARRERLVQAKAQLLGEATTLVEKLTELAESAVTYIDTVLLKPPTVRDPKTPIVE